jgi:hypothetical protein
MKNYICLNHGECSWADERPPRVFSLPEGEENVCPNCESANIKDAVTPKSSSGRIVLLALGAILILFGVYRLVSRFIQDENTSTSPTEQPVDNGKPGVETDEPAEPTKPLRPEIPEKTRPVAIWSRVDGSEFCVDDCVVEYTEQDNLGHTRVRKISNYAKCCPAEN